MKASIAPPGDPWRRLHPYSQSSQKEKGPKAPYCSRLQEKNAKGEAHVIIAFFATFAFFSQGSYSLAKEKAAKDANHAKIIGGYRFASFSIVPDGSVSLQKEKGSHGADSLQ